MVLSGVPRLESLPSVYVAKESARNHKGSIYIGREIWEQVQVRAYWCTANDHNPGIQ
jgi:hypothetical protein